MRRSFAVRMAAVSAVVMLVLSLLGSGWTWWRSEAALRGQLDLALAAEAEALVREYEVLGIAGLAEQTAAYARRRGPVLVLLQTGDGQAIAGRLPMPGPALLRGFATLRVGEEGIRLRALGAVLPGGANLIVAMALAPVETAAAGLAWTPPLVAIAAAGLALLLGFLAARRMEHRLSATSEAARAIMDGDLARRLPDDGRGDEFDRLAATVNLLLARIEALVAAQRQVTDDIAHDLRTPLSRLHQRLEAAQATARDPEADAAIFAEAQAELEAVLATFATLLRIARAESGVGRPQFRPLDLSALAAEMAETYAAVAEEAGRSLTAEIAPGISLSGDAGLLRQALANLLENAILHGGSRIALCLAPGPVLSVEDDGPGIPAAERGRVIERFVRLEASRTTPGTGLGLALVRATAGLHGGTLHLEEAAPHGLRVAIDLSGPSLTQPS